MKIHDVVVRPLITEKSTHQSQALNAYAFEVHPKAGKIEIKQAIQQLYSVRVLDVRTSHRQGKPRRMGRTMGTTKAWKKAVVVLHDQDHIDLF